MQAHDKMNQTSLRDLFFLEVYEPLRSAIDREIEIQRGKVIQDKLFAFFFWEISNERSRHRGRLKDVVDDFLLEGKDHEHESSYVVSDRSGSVRG